MNPGIRGSCFVVMGVSGCGKSSVAQGLARATGGRFVDADDYHTPENLKKMEAGIPLSDDDRLDWLKQLNKILLDHHRNEKGPLFLACSALKQSYRNSLSTGMHRLERSADSDVTAAGGICFLFLNGPFDLIHKRVAQRSGHFMPVKLLENQFEILEKPDDAIWFDVVDPVDLIVDRFLTQFPELRRTGH